jgi:CRP-like cAMP-binding protein
MTDLKRSLEGASFRIVEAPKHTPIFHEGDAVEAIYRVERGCVRLQINDEGGQREIVTFLFPGDLFCVGLETHWASAYAVTDATIAVFSLPLLWEFISQRSDAALALLFSADDLLDDVAHHLALLSHSDAGARLRWFLQWLSQRSTCKDGSGAVHMPMGRRDIADFLGIAPETVSRLFLRLETRGELRRTGGHHCVLIASAGERTPPSGLGPSPRM